jgi:hypothetical protein
VDWSSWSFLLSTCTYPALPLGLSECGQGMPWWWEGTSNGSKGRPKHAQNLVNHRSSRSSYTSTYLLILESLPYLSSYAPTSLQHRECTGAFLVDRMTGLVPRVLKDAGANGERWTEETWSVWIAVQSGAGLFRLLGGPESHPEVLEPEAKAQVNALRTRATLGGRRRGHWRS